MLAYRGQQDASKRTIRGIPSYTTSLPVAIIWSARPGDPWSSNRSLSKAHFRSTSTVVAVDLQCDNPLKLGGPNSTLSDVMRDLRWGEPGGITLEAVLHTMGYMHRRIIGRERGGEFNYTVSDEEGNIMGEADVPFSLLTPMTLISEFYDDFDGSYGSEDMLEVGQRLYADTYVFADAPEVQRAAKRLGHDVITYTDIFQGGISAAEELLGADLEDLGVYEEWDDLLDEGDGGYTPVHDTYRPLVPPKRVWARPVEQVIPMLGIVPSV